MYNFIVILILIVSIVLALVVLVQNSKGGGLAANFAAPNQIMGVRKTTDFLEKLTWGLAIALVVLSLIATITIGGGKKTKTQKNAVSTEQMEMPSAAQALGGGQPVQEAAQLPDAQ
ncbi:MAG: preprotein translocase subunit SecG [Bacteroidales bacterium]|nr:preprotein translocase subunit SecG [Bacteroidales bacterium]